MIDGPSTIAHQAASLDPADLLVEAADVVFDHQDSGCLSYGVTVDGRRWFIKTAMTDRATVSLENAIRFHSLIQHSAIVRLVRVLRLERLTLVYPWVDGAVLNHATLDGSDRCALEQLQRLPVSEVNQAITTVLEAHRHIADAGFVAVDFYDGAMMYDFDNRLMRLIDLDDYRPGPFVLDRSRLPGSTRYMAPEEFKEGSVINQQTNVFTLGRMIHHLLDSESGWRGSPDQAALVRLATTAATDRRPPTVAELVRQWTEVAPSP